MNIMDAPLLASCGSTCRLPGLPFGLVSLCVVVAIVFIAVMTLFKYYFARRATREDAAPPETVGDDGSGRSWK